MAALALTLGAGPSTAVPPAPSAAPAAMPGTTPTTPTTPTTATVPGADPAGATLVAAQGQPAPRVLFVGDSLAAQLGHHAAVALREAGIDGRVAAAWGLGLFTREQYDLGALRPDPPEGTLLRMASDAVAELDPDVVAVYSNHNYWPPHPRDADGAPITWESPAFPGMVRTLLTDLVGRLRAGGATVYLIAPIPLFPPDDQPEHTAIWDAYMAVREELGVEVLTPGAFMARPDGERHDELPDCTGRPRRVRPEADVHVTYFGAGLLGGQAARAVAERLPRPPSPRTATRPTAPAEAPVALVPAGAGYRLVSCDGATFHFGRHTTPVGSAADGQGRTPGDPVVAAASTADGRAALLLTRAGVVLRLDEAGPDVEPAAATVVARVALRPDQRPVGIASAGAGGGFWVATSDGRVDAFAGAADLGDLVPSDSDAVDAGGTAGGAPPPVGERPRDAGGAVVALAAAPDGRGYYLLSAAGRVAGFGTAAHHGDLAGASPASPPVALTVHPDGGGYWLLSRSGTVHAFGAARDHGSAAAVDMLHQAFDRHTADLPPLRLPAAEAPPVEAVALLPTATGRGYWLALASGAVCHFGDAPTLGGIHRAEVDPLMTYVGEPYYGDGPCTPPPHDRLLALSNLYAGIREVLAARAAPPPPAGPG